MDMQIHQSKQHVPAELMPLMARRTDRLRQHWTQCVIPHAADHRNAPQLMTLGARPGTSLRDRRHNLTGRIEQASGTSI